MWNVPNLSCGLWYLGDWTFTMGLNLHHTASCTDLSNLMESLVSSVRHLALLGSSAQVSFRMKIHVSTDSSYTKNRRINN